MMKAVEKSTSKPCNNPFLGFVAFAKSIDSKVNNDLSISCYPSSIFGYPATSTTLKRTLLTHIPHKRVKEWCIKAALTYRRLDNDGHEIADWKQNPKLGHWHINTSKQIGEY